jgi:hypothetical protein
LNEPLYGECKALLPLLSGNMSMKGIIKLIFYLYSLISAGAVFIGIVYLLVNGVDVFLQYRLYLLSKPLTYVVIAVMILCVIVNYFSRKNLK